MWPNVWLCMVVVLLTAAPSSARPKLIKTKSLSSAVSKDPSQCDADKLMVYRVTLATHWSRTLFPKQYPEWRPPAQWSKLVGQFNNSFIPFRNFTPKKQLNVSRN